VVSRVTLHRLGQCFGHSFKDSFTKPKMVEQMKMIQFELLFSVWIFGVFKRVSQVVTELLKSLNALELRLVSLAF